MLDVEIPPLYCFANGLVAVAAGIQNMTACVFIDFSDK